MTPAPPTGTGRHRRRRRARVRLLPALVVTVGITGVCVSTGVTLNAPDTRVADAAGSVASSVTPAPRTATTSRSHSRVEVQAAGVVQEVTTGATNLRQVAKAAGVHLDHDDVVKVAGPRTPVPSLGSEPAPPAGILTTPTVGLPPGTRVVVVDVQVRTRKDVTPIAAPVREVFDPSLPPGTRRVTQPGTPGRKVVQVREVHHDGDRVHRVTRLVSHRPPTAKVVTVGPPPAVSAWPVVPAAQDRNWAALAACESSGNPGVVSASGRYHGLYQFDVSTWASVGGSGLPSQATPQEQTYRAQLLYQSRGASPWPSCGRLL